MKPQNPATALYRPDKNLLLFRVGTKTCEANARKREEISKRKERNIGGRQFIHSINGLDQLRNERIWLGHLDIKTSFHNYLWGENKKSRSVGQREAVRKRTENGQKLESESGQLNGHSEGFKYRHQGRAGEGGVIEKGTDQRILGGNREMSPWIKIGRNRPGRVPAL